MDGLGEILKRSIPPNGTRDPRNYDETQADDFKRRERLLSLLGVNDVSHTFEAIKKVNGIKPVINALRNMGKLPMLMIYGGVGNGKTHCCEAMVIEMFDTGLRAKRDRWSDLVRSMKSHFNGRGDDSYVEYFDMLRSRQTLIIDDIGSGSTLGSWEWGELEDIIDYRYEHRLFTIITTNLDIKQFPERILSRFRDKSVAAMVFNEAPDYRPLK